MIIEMVRAEVGRSQLKSNHPPIDYHHHSNQDEIDFLLYVPANESEIVVDLMSVRMSITIYLSFVQSEEVKEPTANNVEELNA